MKHRSTEQDWRIKLIWVHPLTAIKGAEHKYIDQFQPFEKKFLMFDFFNILKADSICNH
jgi:hypothetical protein